MSIHLAVFLRFWYVMYFWFLSSNGLADSLWNTFSSNFKIHSFGWNFMLLEDTIVVLLMSWQLLTLLCKLFRKPMSLLWACVQMMFFSLAVLTYGTAVPSGQFVPGIMIGATYGRLVGILVVNASSKDSVDEGTYVLWSFQLTLCSLEVFPHDKCGRIKLWAKFQRKFMCICINSVFYWASKMKRRDAFHW